MYSGRRHRYLRTRALRTLDKWLVSTTVRCGASKPPWGITPGLCPYLHRHETVLRGTERYYTAVWRDCDLEALGRPSWF